MSALLPSIAKSAYHSKVAFLLRSRNAVPTTRHRPPSGRVPLYLISPAGPLIPMQSLWMLFATFAFSIMGLCVKLASDLYSTGEIVMYRNVIAVIFMYALIRVNGGTFRTRLPWHHLWRGAVGVLALWLWFYAIGKLPLATGMTLNYMSPIWIAAMLFSAGWWRGQNRFEWGMAAAIFCSFIGVTLLLRPAFHAEQWFAALIGLVSGVLSALAYLQVRKLGLMGEPESRVVFYFSLTGLVAGLLGTLAGPVAWHPHSAKGLALLAAIGISATLAQMAMTRAYRLGKTLVTANLQYTGIVFSSVWGILLWNDSPGWLGWAGIVIILASGLAATYYNTRKINAPAAETAAVAAKEEIPPEIQEETRCPTPP